MVTQRELFILQSRYQIRLLRQQPPDWQLLDAELPNLLKTMEWLSQQKMREFPEQLLQMVIAFADYANAHSLNHVVMKYLPVCLKAAKHRTRYLSKALLVGYQASWAIGSWDQAMRYIKQAVKVSETGDAQVHHQAMKYLGSSQINRGEYQEALRTLQKAHKLSEQRNDLEGEIDAIREEAAYYLDKDEYGMALNMYQGIEKYELNHRGERSIHTLLMLGVVYRKMKLLEEATRMFKNILALPAEKLTQNDRATTLHHLAWVRCDQKRFAEAKSLANQALEIYQNGQNFRGISDVFEQIGEIAFFEGDTAVAEKNYIACASSRRRLHNQPGYASITRRLSKLYQSEGKSLKGLHYLILSTVTYLRVGNLTPARMKRFFVDPWLKRLKSRLPATKQNADDGSPGHVL